MVYECQMPYACNDVHLLEMLRSQTEHAFNFLYKKYWFPLLHFAGQYLDDKDTCEEIVQELFVHLHSRRASLHIKSSISSYLYTALRNRILNHVRNQTVYQKHVHLAVSAGPKTQNNVEQFINLIELQKKIAFSVQKMPNKCREVYVLHNQNHYTIKEVALILNRPVDTVEKQLRKATSLLRSHLKGDGGW